MNNMILATITPVMKYPSPPNTENTFVGWAFVVMLIFFISVSGAIISFMLSYIKTQQKEIKEKIDKAVASFSLDLLRNSKDCEKKRRDNMDYVESSIAYIESSIKNFNNLLFDLISNTPMMRIDNATARSLFEISMQSHCLTIAKLISEAVVKRVYGDNTSEIVMSIENIIKQLVVKEHDTIAKIKLDNGESLSSLIDDLVEDFGWNNYMTDEIKPLIDLHINSRDFVIVFNTVYNTLWISVTKRMSKIK